MKVNGFQDYYKVFYIKFSSSNNEQIILNAPEQNPLYFPIHQQQY